MRITKSIKIGVAMSILGSMALTTPVMAQTNLSIGDAFVDEDYDYDGSYTQKIKKADRNISSEEYSDLLIDCLLSKHEINFLPDDYIKYQATDGMEDQEKTVYDLEKMTNIAYSYLQISDEECLNKGVWIKTAADEYYPNGYDNIYCKCSYSDFNKLLRFYNISAPAWNYYSDDEAESYSYRDDEKEMHFTYFPDYDDLYFHISYNYNF